MPGRRPWSLVFTNRKPTDRDQDKVARKPSGRYRRVGLGPAGATMDDVIRGLSAWERIVSVYPVAQSPTTNAMYLEALIDAIGGL